MKRVFAVADNPRPGKVIRWSSWLFLAYVIALSAISYADPPHLYDPARKFLAGTFLAGLFVFGTCLLVCIYFDSVTKAKRRYRYELDDDRLFQFRDGNPIREIPLNSIASVMIGSLLRVTVKGEML
jgi:hypothetical protein